MLENPRPMGGLIHLTADGLKLNLKYHRAEQAFKALLCCHIKGLWFVWLTVTPGHDCGHCYKLNQTIPTINNIVVVKMGSLSDSKITCTLDVQIVIS